MLLPGLGSTRKARFMARAIGQKARFVKFWKAELFQSFPKMTYGKMKFISFLPKMNQKTGEKVSNLEFYALKFRLILGSFPKLLKLGSARLAGQKARLGSLKSKLGSITTNYNLSRCMNLEKSIVVQLFQLSTIIGPPLVLGL